MAPRLAAPAIARNMSGSARIGEATTISSAPSAASSGLAAARLMAPRAIASFSVSSRGLQPVTGQPCSRKRSPIEPPMRPTPRMAVLSDGVGRRNLAPDCSGDLTDLVHELPEIVERQRLRSVRQGVVGRGVDLDDQAISPARDRGFGHGLDQVPLARAMAGVGDDWQVRQARTQRNGAEVYAVACVRLKRPNASTTHIHLTVPAVHAVLLCQQPFR